MGNKRLQKAKSNRGKASGKQQTSAEPNGEGHARPQKGPSDKHSLTPTFSLGPTVQTKFDPEVATAVAQVTGEKHEPQPVAHKPMPVTQQGHYAANPSLQRKKKAGKEELFYQEVLDAIAREEKTVVHLQRSSFGGFALPYLKKIKSLAEAVTAGDTKAISAAVAALTSEDPPNLAPYVGYEKTFRELVSRLLLLGESGAADQLRVWFLKRRKQEQGSYAPRDSAYSEAIYLWETAVEQAVAHTSGADAGKAVTAIDGLLRVLEALRKEQAGLDPEALKKDRELAASMSTLSDFSSLPFINHSISGYYSRLSSLMQEVFVAFMTTFQVLLDAALADLEAGKSSSHLRTAKDKLAALGSLVSPTKAWSGLLGREVEITRSTFSKKGGRYLDYFAKGKAARRRSVGFENYDRQFGEMMAEEKKLNIEHILFIRNKQIEFLERLYGEERDKSGKVTAEAQENKALIASQMKGRLRLHNNDDWRQFLLAKYEARQKEVGRAQALSHIIELLQFYLRAFTTHSPQNIEDFGDNYLTKSFHRALTGQLIHDCGVYALRIVYMLSLVREKLNLRFRYVRFPLHVGLVITGDGLPAFVAHNDSFTMYTPDQITRLQEQWRTTSASGEARQPPAALDEEQFWGELAAGDFVPGVDIPFRVLDTPATTGKPATIKRRLWQDYMKRVAPTELFAPEVYKPGSKSYQFDLRYLDILQHQKQLHNDYFVPFWNVVARNIWLKHQKAILAALSRMKAAKAKEKTAAEKSYHTAVKRYWDELQKAFQPVQKAMNDVLEVEVALSRDLREHPEVVARGARISSDLRLGGSQWLIDVLADHEFELTMGRNVQPPFVDRKNALFLVN